MVEAVEIVSALKRRPEPQRREVTYFSRKDVWLFVAVLDARVCPLCRRFEDHEDFHGNHLRFFFPRLEIMDVGTIEANVHPNCRCYLVRLLVEGD